MTNSDIPNMTAAMHAKGLSTANSITTLAQSSMFWRPAFLTDSDWLEHIPFAFWLIGAHKPSTVVELGTQTGASYFAMCQAVDRLHLDACCYAVSTWEDENEGAESAYLSVKSHNDAHYSSFSSLVRSTSNQALSHFADHSIDLIHFDKLTGLDADKQLINAWTPKLSERGLVLIHDTNVRDMNLQVHRLFEDLKEFYPSFEFRHGNGLGILGIGKNQPELINVLFEDAQSRSRSQVVQDVFSRLGRACADSYSARISEERTTRLINEATKLKSDLNSVEKRLLSTQQILDESSKEMTELQQRIDQRIETHALERGQLVERSNMVQGLHDQLKEDSKKLQFTLKENSDLLTRKDKELFKLAKETATNVEQLGSLKNEQHKLQQKLSKKANESSLSKKKLDDAIEQFKVEKEHLLATLNAEKSARDTQLESLLQERDQLQQDVSVKEQENLSLEEKLQDAHKQFGVKKEQLLATLNAEKSARDAQLESLLQERDQLQQDVSVKEQENLSLEEKLQDAGKLFKAENESLLDSLNAAQKELEHTESQKNQEISSLKLSVKKLTRQFNEDSAKKDSQLAIEVARNKAVQDKANQLQNSVTERFKEIAKLVKLLETNEEKWESEKGSLISQHEEDVRSLRATIALQKTSIAERFREIAELTRLLELLEKKSNIKVEALLMDTTNTTSLSNPQQPSSSQSSASKLLTNLSARKHVKLIRQSELFDAEWYRNEYPDVSLHRKFKNSPARHYCLFGGFERRNPSKKFNSGWYLEQNPDVIEEKINPLVHYILHGKSEGRLPMPVTFYPKTK